jgi:hypothetical protein
MALSKSTNFGTLYFPDDLRSGSRPLMQLVCNSVRSDYHDSFFVYLPVPLNLQFADAATYNDAELNAAGMIGGALSAARSGGITGASNYLGNLKGSIPNSLPELGQLAASMAPLDDSVKSAISIGLGTTLNKNITTEFTGMATRRFHFAFKFMAKSKSESEMIRNISRAFRIGLYADGNSLQLQYPPTWTIRFLDGNGSDLEYIPKIYECYLETANVSYNQTANIWFSDGAPLECDLSLSFIETRALTAEDIRSLDDAPFNKLASQVNFNNFDASSIPSGRDNLNAGPGADFSVGRV